MSQIRLGDLLVRASVIDAEQLAFALREQRRSGERLGSTLVRLGLLTEDLVVLALSRQLNLPRASLAHIEPDRVPPWLRERVDQAFCEQHLVLLVGFVPERQATLVAVVDPLNSGVLEDVRQRLGTAIELQVAGESQLRDAMARIYGTGEPQTGNAQLPAPTPATGTTPPTPAHSSEELRAAALQQRRATRALLELLVQRGLLDAAALQMIS
jgi:hypothetical protein